MKNLIVIDHFYQDPLLVRDYALKKAQFLSAKKLPQDFAGTESLKGFYSTNLIFKIEKSLGQKIEVDPKKFAFGVFSKTTDHDSIRKTIHVDGSDWTGILYLSKPEDCKGGTITYRHLKTGWTEIPDQTILQKNGYLDRADFIQQEVTPNGQDFSKWAVSARVGMVFNRLVLFKSSTMFHSAESYFGTNDDDCRLTQLFFFNLKEHL